MENINNITLMCKECSDERKREFQKSFNKYNLEVGGLVKKEFTEGKKTEHMWVKIVSLTEDGINGILDNEPFVLKKIKLGSKVFVNFNEIEQSMK